MDVSTLKINCDVAQVNAAKVRPGQRATIIADTCPGVVFTGTVRIVNPALDAKTRTLPVEIHSTGRASSDGRAALRPGMFVVARIHLGTTRGLAAPRDALMRLPGTGVYYVFVVNHGKAEKRSVTLGVARGNEVEIVQGLKQGDCIVVRGQGQLRTGTPVKETKQKTVKQ